MSKDERYDESTGFEVAVVGAACRLPGAHGLDEYWGLLSEGRETIRRFTPEELIEAGVDPDVVGRPNYVPVKPVIGGADLFDASFFNYSPREAELIDPQGRLLLELAWEALESAGFDPQTYEGLTGVYTGGRLGKYMLRAYRNADAVARSGDFGVQVGSDKDYLAPRISYKLNLGGPSVNVQTACSSGLVAVHLACQSLVAGECDLALAGASSLDVPEVEGYFQVPGGVLSRQGHVRAFDADADGTIFGNGIGMVVLRRLDDALADGDTILAVVKGSAVSNDGSQRVGFTAPGVEGQRRVIRAAQIAADVDADTIGYVEAHGTGTAIGDPIEIEALSKAFRETTDRRGYCAVASAKSNIGHLSAASGVAGLLKVILALKHRRIPPACNFERPNPQIEFDTSPFYVPTELREWTANGMPLRAGVSAFGIGGTNAHLIVEEPPAPAPVEPSRREHQLIVVSARTPGALAAACTGLGEHLRNLPEARFADAAYTLRRGRQAFEMRRVAVCRGPGEAAAVLAGERPQALLGGGAAGAARPVVFMFSGQGAQYPGMGHDLYRDEPVFRDAVDRCTRVLEPELGLDLRELLFPEEDADGAAERLERTAYTQPALFAVELALATLWRSWGVEPAAMIGHSVGEYVAACLAGVFSVEDALTLVAARGRLMQEQPPGDMLAVPLPEAELEGRLGPEVAIAALNAPGRSVVSGPADAVEALRAELEADGVACRRLHTSHAFHSAMMEPMLPAFLERFQGVELSPPTVPFVSNVTGTWIGADEATDPGYWARHVLQAVRFADGLETLAADGERIYLEVGPGRTLATLARQNRAVGREALVLSSLRHPRAEVDDDAFALETLGRLWMAGVPVDWKGFHAGERRSRIPLPTYPFERRSYWIDAPEEAGALTSGPPRPKADPGDWFSLPSWRPSVVPVASEPSEESAPWVLFAEASGPSAALADAVEAHLATRGGTAVRVEPGESFHALEEGRYRVGSDSGSYDALLDALDATGTPPRRWAHLWNVGDGARDLETSLDRSFWSLLTLARSLGKRGGDERTSVAVVTTGMQQVAGEAVPHPERATVLGPVQVLPQETARVAAASFDLGPGFDGAEDLDGQARALVSELEAGLPDPLVAYRGSERWVRGVAPVHLAPASPEALRVRAGGVYLITGGLGGFGRTFAEHLAREHGARLVLLGRTPLPARELWDATEAGDDARSAARVRFVRELEALGAEVLVEAADVTDPASLKAVLGRARERFGPLHGVIHAAGVPGGGMIQLKEREAAARVLAPKVHGTLALERALEGEEPDFVVLCSSTIALLGGFGQVDYCAANNFLDAFARSRRGRGSTYTVSLDWGAWKDVGMAVETTLPTGAAAALGSASAAPGAGEGPAELAPFEGEPLHPLLGRLVEEGRGRKVFATRMSPETHWMLAEHRIQGRPVLPGTSYLEMVRRAFEEAAGPGPLEIRDLMFVTPVVVPEGTRREVRVALEESRDPGAWSFRITSSDRAEGPWTEHAMGNARRASGEAAERVDLDALRAGFAGEVLELAGHELTRREKLVEWGPRWESLRRVHRGDGEGIVHLELPEAFSSDLDALALHPALVDVATAIGAGALAEGAFLPLSYRRVVVHEPLPASFDSHIRTAGTSGGETTTLDVTFVGPGGERLVEVEGFIMKRVAAGIGLAAVSAPAEQATPEEPRTLLGGEGMSPAQGVEVLRRVLAHGRHPQIAVSPRDLEWLLAQARKPPRLEAADGGATTSRAKHPRPELATPYAAPRTPLEETLAAVWSAALGVEEVGIHDNFFDLGGDSILGIQIIARAGEAGVRLAPELLFEHQTIADLSAELGDGGPARPVAETWEEWLREQAEGPWRESVDYWLSEERLDLPALASGAAAAGERRAVTAGLDAEVSRQLLVEALPELRATLEEAALAAVARVVSRAWRSDRLLVRLRADGRDVAPRELGLGGQDTPLPYHFPVVVDLGSLEDGGLASLVRTVKEQRRAVPHGGAPWFALLHLSTDPAAAQRLGAMPVPPLALSVVEVDGAPDPGPPPAAIEVRVFQGVDRVELAWSFDPAVVEPAAAEALAVEACDLLRRIAGETGVAAVSPSDFPDAGLDDDALETVLSKLGG